MRSRRAFLKTGGEACAAAIRIARAYTGREHVIQIGYKRLAQLSGVRCEGRAA
ncbi:MAG: hypothetical protein ACOXZM_10585 [Eubacteriales bacterium]